MKKEGEKFFFVEDSVEKQKIEWKISIQKFLDDDKEYVIICGIVLYVCKWMVKIYRQCLFLWLEVGSIVNCQKLIIWIIERFFYYGMLIGFLKDFYL